MEFFFDTETTGIPQKCGFKYPDPKDTEFYDSSRIVSISWIVTQQHQVVTQAYFVIKPDGFLIPQESTNIHGITTEHANEKGVEISVVFSHLKDILPMCSTMVAHNVLFDINVLKSELFRYNEASLLSTIDSMKAVCTMKKGKHVLNMKSYPKLSVLYKALYDEEMQNAHDAQYDTYYCYKCYIKMFPVDKTVFFFGDRPVNLTEAQTDIVYEDPNKNILVIACAGAGKTMTVLCRIKHLIQTHNVDDNSIMMTTFTRDAANEMKNKLFDIMGYNPSITVGTLDSIARRFTHTTKQTNGLKDVSEYAYEFLSKIRSDPTVISQFKYMFVDEFQDINDIQYQIINEFYKAGCKIFAVGDDAQNIYTFRGSKIEFILNFSNYFENATVKYLIDNFRSTQAIINMANACIEKNESSIPKKMCAALGIEGEKPLVRYFPTVATQTACIVEAIGKLVDQGVAPHDIAILSPVNQSLFLIEEQLTKKGINNVYLDGKCDVKTSKKPWHVCLSTVHKSKGLEWEYVFLTNMSDEVIPKTKTPLQIEESRRLFYVGVTRARKQLHVYYTVMIAKQPYVTRFVSELDKELFTTENMIDECYGKSDLEYAPLELSVTKLIDNLDGNDYIVLKEKGILPTLEKKDIKRTKIYESFGYAKIIEDNDLYSDFGIFIEKLIKREVAAAFKSTKLSNDKHVIMCLANVKLDPGTFVIFQNYRTNFKNNLRFLKPYMIDIHGNKYKIKCILEQNAKLINNAHFPIVLMILMSIRQKAEYFNIEPHEVPVFSKSFLPNGFEVSMEKSLKQFRNLEADCDIQHVWDVSKCKKIVTEYRRRLLYKNIEVVDFDTDYSRLYYNIKTPLMQFLTTMAGEEARDIATDETFEAKEREGVFGELDLRINGTIIDYKTSINDRISMQWLTQLLCYKVLADVNGKNIKTIGILNALKGWYDEVDVSAWNKHSELLTYLVEKRDKLRAAA